MTNNQPPELVMPPERIDSLLTIQDVYDLGLMHEGRMEEAAERLKLPPRNLVPPKIDLDDEARKRAIREFFGF